MDDDLRKRLRKLEHRVSMAGYVVIFGGSILGADVAYNILHGFFKLEGGAILCAFVVFFVLAWLLQTSWERDR